VSCLVRCCDVRSVTQSSVEGQEPLRDGSTHPFIIFFIVHTVKYKPGKWVHFCSVVDPNDWFGFGLQPSFETHIDFDLNLFGSSSICLRIWIPIPYNPVPMISIPPEGNIGSGSEIINFGSGCRSFYLFTPNLDIYFVNVPTKKWAKSSYFHTQYLIHLKVNDFNPFVSSYLPKFTSLFSPSLVYRIIRIRNSWFSIWGSGSEINNSNPEHCFLCTPLGSVSERKRLFPDPAPDPTFCR